MEVSVVYALTLLMLAIAPAVADEDQGVPFKLQLINETLDVVDAELEDVSPRQQQTLHAVEEIALDFCDLESPFFALETDLVRPESTCL